MYIEKLGCIKKELDGFGTFWNILEFFWLYVAFCFRSWVKDIQILA